MMKALTCDDTSIGLLLYWGETSAFMDDFKGSYRYPECGAKITYSSDERIAVPGEFL